MTSSDLTALILQMIKQMMQEQQHAAQEMNQGQQHAADERQRQLIVAIL